MQRLSTNKAFNDVSRDGVVAPDGDAKVVAGPYTAPAHTPPGVKTAISSPLANEFPSIRGLMDVGMTRVASSPVTDEQLVKCDWPYAAGIVNVLRALTTNPAIAVLAIAEIHRSLTILLPTPIWGGHLKHPARDFESNVEMDLVRAELPREFVGVYLKQSAAVALGTSAVSAVHTQ